MLQALETSGAGGRNDATQDNAGVSFNQDSRMGRRETKEQKSATKPTILEIKGRKSK